MFAEVAFSPPFETEFETEVLCWVDVEIFGVDKTGDGRVALLLDGVVGEVFETVDDMLVDAEGADACTKSFRVGEITDVLPGIFLEAELGVNVVLLDGDVDDELEIGTCFTVMVVPEGIFLVRFLLVILPDNIEDGFEDGLEVDKDDDEVLLSIDFLTD